MNFKLSIQLIGTLLFLTIGQSATAQNPTDRDARMIQVYGDNPMYW